MSALSNAIPTEAYVRERPASISTSRFRELEAVVVDIAVTTLEGDHVPAGTEGTIVAVWRDGSAYDVEFADALGPATVTAEHVKVAARS